MRLLVPLMLAGLAYAGVVKADVVTDVRQALAQGNVLLAKSLLEKEAATHGGTPEVIEGLSWMARAALVAKQYDQAEAWAAQTEKLSQEWLKRRPLDAEPHLPIALGAAIEVQAQVLDARGERGDALTFLRKELATYDRTSIAARIRKNINLLDMTGKPAPALDEHEYLGPKPPPLAALRGKPVLLFFWAHWCPDCKQERADLAQIQREFAGKGLTIIGPTQLYGYVENGAEAKPDQELKYIDMVRHKFYADLLNMPAPVSAKNFQEYGASTTPTLVVINKRGIVSCYHPGRMSLQELENAIRAVL